MIQAIDLRLDLARPTLYHLGHVKRAAAVLREAEAVARALGDDRRLGRVIAHLIFCLRVIGQKSEAIEAGRRALRIAKRLSDIEIEIPANTVLGQVFHDKGDYRQAVRRFRRNIEVLVGDLALPAFRGGAPRSIHSRTLAITSLAELGEFDEAADLGRRGVARGPGSRPSTQPRRGGRRPGPPAAAPGPLGAGASRSSSQRSR